MYLGGFAFSPSNVIHALRTPTKELRRDEIELTYLLESLNAVQAVQLSRETWRDYTNAWTTLIKLRKKILAKRGHAIIRCVVSDLSVIDGLGAATQMLQIAGEVPNEVLLMLSDGPVAHISTHAFRYRTLIDKELFAILRVKSIQKASIAVIHGAVVAAMIGAFNQLFQYGFAWYFGDVLIQDDP